MREIDLNADIGELESGGSDAALVPLLSSANIAGGMHAGNRATMSRSIALCLENDVAMGAHPSFPDREGFGRRAMTMPAAELRNVLLQQIDALSVMARAQGARLRHVKPHGALYNIAATHRGVAETLTEAIRQYDPALMLVGLAHSRLAECARESGLVFIAEGFADRRYSAGAILLDRSHPRAMIDDEREMEAQVSRMVLERFVIAEDGSRVPLSVDTICVHGDGANAFAFAQRITRLLSGSGVKIGARR